MILSSLGYVFGKYLAPLYKALISLSYFQKIFVSIKILSMIEGDLSQYLEFFKQIYLFNGLENGELEYLIRNFELCHLNESQIIYREGEPASYFYIVFRGSAQFIQRETDGKQTTRTLISGEYFGEDDLLKGKGHASIAVALEDTDLFQLSSLQFDQLINEHAEIRKYLYAIVENRILAKKIKFNWLQKDEVLLYLSRKHEFFFFRALIFPLFLITSAFPLFFFSLSVISLSVSTAALFATIVFIAGGVLLGVWNWLDWSNDFYFVTNRRVLWLEQIIGLYQSRREAPLSTILAINTTSSQWGRILNYGNVEVRTFTGGFLMKNLPKPDLFASFIKEYLTIAKQHQKHEELKAMEETLRRKFGITDNAATKQSIISENITSNLINNKVGKSGSLREIFDTFFKVRYEKGGIITYRKHWFVLMRKIAYPSIMCVILFVLMGFLIHRFITNSHFILSWSVWLLLLVPVFISTLIWWGYQYLDWSNDIYRLTPEQILDIEKKPLGKEDKKTASLDSILSIEHTRKGILELLLNFGKVIVSVGQTKFIFYNVSNPGRVHQDIADYMEERNRRLETLEMSKEREHMADWLKAYHEQIKDKENPREEDS